MSAAHRECRKPRKETEDPREGKQQKSERGSLACCVCSPKKSGNKRRSAFSGSTLWMERHTAPCLPVYIHPVTAPILPSGRHRRRIRRLSCAEKGGDERIRKAGRIRTRTTATASALSYRRTEAGSQRGAFRRLRRNGASKKRYRWRRKNKK